MEATLPQRPIVSKNLGNWSFGGQDETFAKREVEDEIAARLAAILAVDPNLKASKPRVPRIFG